MPRRIKDGDDEIRVFKDKKKYKPTVKHLTDRLVAARKSLRLWEASSLQLPGNWRQAYIAHFTAIVADLEAKIRAAAQI